MNMKNSLLPLLMLLASILTVFLLVMLPSAHDADIRNRYFAGLDYQFLESEFSKERVQFYDALGDYNGLYGSISLYVNARCTIPSTVISYFKKYKLGNIMHIELILGPPGTNEVIESKVICFAI